MKTLHLDLGERGYDITVGRGLLASADKYFNLNRRVFIVTDSGVPAEYAKTLKELCSEAKIVTVFTIVTLIGCIGAVPLQIFG